MNDKLHMNIFITDTNGNRKGELHCDKVNGSFENITLRNPEKLTILENIGDFLNGLNDGKNFRSFIAKKSAQIAKAKGVKLGRRIKNFEHYPSALEDVRTGRLNAYQASLHYKLAYPCFKRNVDKYLKDYNKGEK